MIPNHKVERKINEFYKNLKFLPVWKYKGVKYTYGDFYTKEDILLSGNLVIYRNKIWVIYSNLYDGKVCLEKTFNDKKVYKYTRVNNLRKIIKFN